MSEAEFEITGVGLRKLAVDAAAVDPKLKLALRRNLRAAAQVVKAAVQANAAEIPAGGGKQTGLRAAIANAATIRVGLAGREAKVRVEVAPGKMPANQQGMPAAMEGKSFRHPVFGSGTTKWVTQDGHPYFRPAVEETREAVQAAIRLAAEEATALLTRG